MTARAFGSVALLCVVASSVTLGCAGTSSSTPAVSPSGIGAVAPPATQPARVASSSPRQVLPPLGDVRRQELAGQRAFWGQWGAIELPGWGTIPAIAFPQISTETLPWWWSPAPQTQPPQTQPPQTQPPQTQPPQTQPPQTQPPGVGSSTWPAEWASWEAEVLRLTNERRAVGAFCGGTAYPPAAPLAMHPALQASSRTHSLDMAQRGYFGHDTPEGYGPSDRAQAAGYAGSFVGENIAAGQNTPAEAVQAWIDSPGHCQNLMDRDYAYLGVGFVFESASPYGEYWTQNFGG